MVAKALNDHAGWTAMVALIERLVACDGTPARGEAAAFAAS
jgi:hypothetical protein